MYTSASSIINELGDIDVTVHNDQVHLHHLCLPNHDAIGHAVSDDALEFRPAAVALHTGDPGTYDDDMIWTMHTVQNPVTGLYHMYYTACSLAENGLIQRVALATSGDFVHWEKYAGNPVCEAAAPFYNGTLELLGRVAFRDPFVFIEDGVWHLLVCASTAEGDRLRRGCVAHATSTDGFDWNLQPPLYAPCQFDDVEVPALIKLQDQYYLFFHEFRTPRSRYRIANRLDGPWLAPDHDEPLPDNNAVNRFCEWHGRTLMYTWYRCEADWPRRSPVYASLVPPKEVRVNADGTLRFSSFPGWKDRATGNSIQLTFNDLCAFAEGPGQWQNTDDRIIAGVTGQLVAFAEPVFADFILETTARLDSGTGLGLVFRANRTTEDGNWLRLDFARNRVELHHYTAKDSGLGRYVRKQPSLKQAFDINLARDTDLRLRLVAAREYVELSVNDQVVVSAVTYAQTQGRVGVFVENGTGGFGPINIQPINAPQSGG